MNNTGGKEVIPASIQSELHLAHEDLRWSEKRYRKIFDQSKDGIIVFDPEQHWILDLNNSMAAMFGYTRDELLSKNIMVIWPDQLSQIVSLEQAAVAGHPVSDVNLECELKNGRVIQVEISASLIDLGGLPSILCVVRDETDRKRSEETLRESEKRFRSFFEHAPEYCYIVSPEGNILDVNRAALEILGYERDELVGKPITRLIAPESQRKVKKLIINWRDTGELLNQELIIATKTGAYRQILLSAGAVKDDCGKLLYSILIQKDITELKQAQEHVVRAAKLAALGQLAAGIAHEVNNPLSVILLSVESALYESEGLDDNLHRALVVAKEAALRAGNIVANILEFARERPRHRQRCNLHDLIDKVLNITSADTRHAKVKIQREYMTTTPQLHLDAIEIQQIFMNIVINAIQAMPEGGTLLIRTLLVDDGSKIAIEFTDTGVGIPESTKAKIFDPFYTTKPEGVGTGLGLSISYGLVEAHGGEIKVHSKVGEGTTFTVLFPIDHSELQIQPINPLENSAVI